MIRDKFKLIHSELIMQVQCIEKDLKLIYAGMHRGDFEKNLDTLEKANLGTVIKKLKDLDYSDGHPNLSEQDYALLEQARQLRFDPAFPKGANVNLYTWLDENTIRILTFERGVEDYTLACGTGSASTAVVLWLKGKCPTGKLTVKNKGGDLTVTVEGSQGHVDALWLEGPAVVVKEYEI